MEKISEYLREFWWVGLMGLVGGGILIYGLWGVIKPSEVKVEIVKSQNTNSQILKSNDGEQVQIVVDVAGAVEKPGVYKLPSGSRIGDALVVAGGLGEKADREWVARTVNLAETVKDGGKVYIPEKSQIVNSQISNSKQMEKSNLFNVNTASVGELDSLEGIGESRAQAIIDNRPYGSTKELVSKAKIPQNVYDKIKDSLSVY